MPSFLPVIASILAISSGIDLSFAAHAGFHVQYPWMTRRENIESRPRLDHFNPFCRDIFRNPQEYSRHSRTFLSFSGHPGDLVTSLYTRHRAPGKKEDFPHMIFQDVPIPLSGQLCLNVTISFETEVNEMGVMYFEARDPVTGVTQYHCSDVMMADMTALPEEHPAMCAANNETLIPMPDEYL